MANQITLNWMKPQNSNFVEDLYLSRYVRMDSAENDSRLCIFTGDVLRNEAEEIDTALLSHAFRASFISLVNDTCENTAAAVKDVHGPPDELAPQVSRKLEHLELEVQDTLSIISDSFKFLSYMEEMLINTSRSLKFARSHIRMVPDELWSRIFSFAVAPLGAIDRDDRIGYYDNIPLDTASPTGTRYCCPDTITMVCRKWKHIALRTPEIWRNISKAHCAPPIPISSVLTDSRIKELARRSLSKGLLNRLLCSSLQKDRLMLRAPVYAERSGVNSALYVDLRFTAHPISILNMLRPYFSRIEALYLDRWDQETIDFLDTMCPVVDGTSQQTYDCLFPRLKTLSYTPASTENPLTSSGASANRCIFPQVFKEASNLKNLKIGFQFALISQSFYNVPWRNLEVLELDRILDCCDILWVLKECTNLRDAIISCPFVEGRDPFLPYGSSATMVIELPHLRSLHYQSDSDYNDNLMLLRHLDMPKLEVLSINADVSSDSAWLESIEAEELIMQKMFCGAWPRFKVLELLHYDASDEEEVNGIKNSMHQFITNNVPHDGPSRTIHICGHGITEAHEERFHLCASDSVGGSDRLHLAVLEIDNCV